MKKIVILTGGTSQEREIAIQSAKTFQKHIKQDFDTYIFPEDLNIFLQNKGLYHLAIPVFHGEYGEDGQIFAFLNTLGIPTIFSPYETHAIGLNKYISNIIAEGLKIKVPKQYIYKTHHQLKTFPVIIKPNKGGSSLFTYKIENQKEFEEKIKYIKSKISDDILVQDFITAYEYSVSIVQGEVLPIMKLNKQNTEDFFDYESKYLNQTKIQETWPKIEKKLENDLKIQAKTIYETFGCKGMARVDFLVDNDNEIYFLEINTIPGMTASSIVPKSRQKTGRSISELITTLLQ